VTDSGVGISEENRIRLFEPFFTTKEMGRGTGLGLSMVYGIVQQSEGWIDVVSEPGKGTTFNIYLPALDQLPPVGLGAEADQTPRKRATGTVLLAEDQDSVRALIKAVLESEGFRVLEASGGDAALKVARRYSEKIDLLITDVIMRDMTGKQLADVLLPSRPTTRVLYVSGYSEDVVSGRGALEGDVEYLAKPFSSDSLTRKIHEILNDGATGPHRSSPAIFNPAADGQVDPGQRC
jgi:CheY-like chemotaxis protein